LSVERVEVLERVESRWRVRVLLEVSAPPRGFTVGFVGEDGTPLGPAVVAAEGMGREVVVEVRGPCTLPPGTVARVVLYTDGIPAETCEVVVARRRGLHAWLSADSRLPLVSKSQPEPLRASDRARLQQRWCWFAAEDEAAQACAHEVPLPDDLRDMLAEFGVDEDDVSDELRATLRGG